MSTIDITDAVEAAARAQYARAAAARPDAPRWEDCAEHERAVHRGAVRPHVEAAAPFIAARSLQDAATALRTTRPVDAARRGLEYPAVELQAMAHRHTAAHRPPPATVPSRTAPARSAGRIAGAGSLQRARTALAAHGRSLLPGAVRTP